MKLRQREPRRHIRPNESPVDLAGQRFGSMVVLYYAPEASEHHGRTYWRIQCDCGKEMDKQWKAIRDGVRCGACTPIVHGHSRRAGNTSSEYRAWRSMKDRCTNPKDTDFHHYGGRGITVCERWISSFVDFYSDMGPKPTSDHSIDRINNNGNYEPGNCKWSTWIEQNNNKRPRKDAR